MKVTKAQAQANRTRIVETASTLFREHGYDGVGVADLMAAAGLTHGGFYKHFQSKTDLMAEAATCGISQTVAMTKNANPATVVEQYLSRLHRDTPSQGCTMAALCSDAARQPAVVKAAFASGLEDLLAVLTPDITMDEVALQEARAKSINTFAHALGALILSRSCPDDSPLADEILEVCRSAIQSNLAASSEQ
ncbi:TetR/AcrR family transcriptional regulator [Thiofilum flexile]|uniref:TetR/AcrR family transcriptional regulator n=1 Tax=Thiofilum flexile TaxID=125627 RepID=UPI000372E4BC|nr:TetR/AcrR family transcriptional regulator [Thiofilum flexile]